jgi:hypothetical protein
MKKSSKQKPLAVVRGAGVTAEIHSSKFVPFESTKYLDLAALKKVKKALIEIGTVESGGKTATCVATISKGFITKLSPTECANCHETSAKAAPRGSATKKVAREALEQIRKLGKPALQLPIPVAALRREIKLGPIVILCGDTSGCDLCIDYIDENGWSCIYCIFSGVGLCIGPVVFLPRR